MSTPPFLTLPPSARALRVVTARGQFAALRAEPAGEVRGSALLVPGFTGSKEDFIALLEPLASAGYRVTAVDQRGQYETGGPHDDPAAYAVAALGADVRALTAALAAEGGTGPLHLLGHSLGGQVVREAVLAAASEAAAGPTAPGGAPLPWASLTLMSTGPGPIDPAEAERTRLLVEVLPTMGLEEIWQVMQQMEKADEKRARRVPSPEVAAFLHRRWLANVPQSLIATGGHLVAAPDRVAELAAVITAGLPALVLSGVQDYAWPVPEQTAMAERLGAHRVVVADAGHSPNAEQPAATAEALLAHWG
ncbi:alpha/beta fold hydrolase [Kitasatospora purpeofusca]|uniref:alpha/beta fold hydrolase n=1 Tax=Kitasatospora purpeofusca TaxID=67352 RepID=UPI00225536E3|nr:alpha/beta hydrolase [Kitasatospora purpeofusca]MCX4754738.1 alpha/beta hydrolase [Kitasatospora purpeofusca]WSR34134.1 alpha/beta hydrolase [Kitasatospora purpeofusca]WSR42360.1 alpha/beta hydrolase [Kitasatospora purpeofusca]